MKNKIIFFTAFLVGLVGIAFNFSVQADGLQASLGHGWSSDNQGPLDAACLVKGTVTYAGAPSSSLSLDNRYSYEDVKQQLNLSGGGGFTLPGFGMNGDASFSEMIENTSYSQAFTYRAHIKLKNCVYNPPQDKSPLNWLGQQYNKDPQKFREYCGDKFVAQQEIGGSLYIAVKYDFFTQKDKETFNESFNASGIGSLFDFHEKFSKIVTSVKKRGHVSIIAHQIGGDPAYLSEILGTTKKGNIAISKCSLEDLTACETALGSMLAYAAQSANNGFPSQFNQDSPGPNGPAVLKNVPEAYNDIAPSVTVGKSLLTPEITAARKLLSKAYQTNISQYNLVMSVKNNGLAYTQPSLDTLNSLLNKLAGNLTALNNVASSCYSGDLSSCVTDEQQAINNLTAVDTTFLQKPKTWILTLNPNKQHGEGVYKYYLYQTLETATGNLLWELFSYSAIRREDTVNTCFSIVDNGYPTAYSFSITEKQFTGLCKQNDGYNTQQIFQANSSDNGKTYAGTEAYKNKNFTEVFQIAIAATS